MTTKTDYAKRLEALRQIMKEKGIAAVIIPQADPHLGEYLASHWQVRRWLSGFTGSAGDLLVTLNDAALWTDSRYFIQAAQQLEGTGIALMKDGLPDTPTMTQYLCTTLPAGSVVGVDGMLFSSDALKSLGDALANCGIKLNCRFDVIDQLWLDRPALPQDKIYVHDIAFAGESATDKLEKIIKAAHTHHADSVLMSALDEIAWTLNIRSNDVRHTPVATAYLFVDNDRATLFTDTTKVDDQLRNYLADNGVEVKEYTVLAHFIEALPATKKVLVDIAHSSGGIIDLLGQRVVDGGTTEAAKLKSVKNGVQLDNLRRVMERDGVALVKAFRDIEKRVADGVYTTELDVAEILRHYRSQGDNYTDESFGTIAGYGAHGAIVHYEASEDSASTLHAEGLLLIDSGAQYLDGTTDITRTIALGTPTVDERRHFTLVMKGHIALAQAIFPAGTRGAQLDVLARQFLWKEGLNYLHGTGHGVGFFLSVHEGPHSIRLNNVEAPLLPGSVTSNEPGVYIEGLHGIRCENLVLCREENRTLFGDFLGFETLTLFPFDLTLFDLSIMTADEIEWVDSYHREVYNRLAPYLNPDERQWLEEKTKALK